MVIDPMLPDAGFEWFEQHGAPAHALLTNRHHDRHAWDLQEHFGTTVHCIGNGMHEIRSRAGESRAVRVRRRAPGRWDTVIRVTSGRALGPVRRMSELRRVRHPDEPGLQTLIVMEECAGLDRLIAELAAASGLPLPVPPAHITLYPTDPARGIGITDLMDRADAALYRTRASPCFVLGRIGARQVRVRGTAALPRTGDDRLCGIQMFANQR